MTARPKNVPVADDEEDVLKLVSSNLKNAGFGVLAAKDGATALELARTEFPALIVLDLMLPGISGLEVCRLLKADPQPRASPSSCSPRRRRRSTASAAWRWARTIT